MMMLKVLLGVMLVGLAASDDANCPQPFGRGPGLGDMRVASRLADRIDALEKRMDTAKERVTGYVHEGEIVRARVDSLYEEAHHCKSHHFQCGFPEDRCMLDTKVCDHVKDCANGHDEDDDICTNRLPIGSVFDGDMPSGACGADIDHIRFTVIWEQRLSYFPSQIQLKAAVTVTHHDGTVESNIKKGYYSFSDHAVFLEAEDGGDGRISLIDCIFDGVQDDRCVAEMRDGSGHICATFGLVRLDDHH